MYNIKTYYIIYILFIFCDLNDLKSFFNSFFTSLFSSSLFFSFLIKTFLSAIFLIFFDLIAPHLIGVAPVLSFLPVNSYNSPSFLFATPVSSTIFNII